MKPLRPFHSPRRAFTLLEILVATAVLCLLVVLLNNIIGSAMDVVGQGRRAFEVHSKARAAMDLLGRDLGQGLYRSEIGSFQDGSGNSALAFFTRRGASIAQGDNSTDYRQLSFVVYQARDEADSGFCLWRGAVNVQWDLKGTYPPAPGLDGPMPFSAQTIPVAYSVARDESVKTFEPVLKGVARLEVKFLGADGRYRSTYNSDPKQASFSKAAVITFLLVDERTEAALRANPALLGQFRQTFISDASSLDVPAAFDSAAGSEVSLGSYWTGKLDSETMWSALPANARRGINTVERIVPLR